MTSSTYTSKRNAFVTGAANGIGKAIVQALVKDGWRVGAADVDDAGLQRLLAELGEQHVSIFHLDVTNVSQWQACLSSFVQSTGQLNMLVNNAGVLVSGNFQDEKIERHHWLYDINIKGVTNGCHAAFSYLQGVPGARIINLSSASATYGQASLASYSTSKFAVRGFTEALNIEWERFDIRVMDMMPLFVQTNMVDGMQAKSIERMGTHITPEQVAAQVVKAANYRGSFGQVHWHVGPMSGLLFGLNSITPAKLARWVASKIAT